MSIQFIPTFGTLKYYLGGLNPPKNEIKYNSADYLNSLINRIEKKESKTILKTISQLINESELNFNKVNIYEIEFVNYGYLEIIFRLKFTYESKQFSFIIISSQLPSYVDKVHQDFIHTKDFQQYFPNFILQVFDYDEFKLSKSNLPISFFTQIDINLCRCIAKNESYSQNWGIYNPEPIYRFEPFDDELSEFTKQMIIASLIGTYNHQLQKGVACSRASGDDFILLRTFDYSPKSMKECWRMISVRDEIEIDFQSYCDLVTKEFQIPTKLSDKQVIDNSIKINHKSKEAFSLETIQKGIELGKEMSKFWINKKEI
ncbi:hypothetical protein M0811_06721 [Anaeramoeba ignava]|uniref:Uncharacterized protein n=1 Tax=Anaeramoeba ignava TaxID=1746090 RepID=A0A9Q0LNY8_ANAIG|nr:hypothetical protein M0811_06721 [Anaeramoeba ignava]